METNGRKRNHRVQIWLSDSEKKDFLAKVNKSGLSIQDYFLMAISNSLITSLDITRELTILNKNFAEYVREIREMGNKISYFYKKNPFPGILEEFKAISTDLSDCLKEGDTIWQSIRSLIGRLKHINH